MGAWGVGVADAVEHRHLALVVELLDRPHVGVEGHLVVDLDALFQVVAHRGAVVHVEGVVVGDDRVVVVVAAGELQDHYDRVFLGCRHASLLACFGLACCCPCLCRGDVTSRPAMAGLQG